MNQLALFSVRMEKRARPPGLLARVSAWVSQLAWGIAVRLHPAPKPKKKRHETAEMVRDVLDASWALVMGGGRVVTKHWYCARLARGDAESRGRRWSTFRACLRSLGIEHETAPDEAGVLLRSPLSAYQAAQKALPPVGVSTEKEENQHEAARRDAEVWIGLGVARVHGPMGVSGVEGLVRLAGVLR